MADSPRLQHPPGTFDVLPPTSARWESLLAHFRETMASAGYGLVVTPSFEEIGVFQRVGASTDVVKKQMYDFEDKGGRHLALRPEFTAQLVRAYIQHHPMTPWKVWAAGSSFRYEHAQAGRYREFHQLDIEAIGTDDPDVDVEIIALGAEFYSRIGLHDVQLLVNSLGDDNCRPQYRRLLVEYLASHANELCEEHHVRYEENPLRVLDCKKAPCQKVSAHAPRQIDHLCDPCREHFARVRSGLEALGVAYSVDTSLVRGLDYYTRTTFEYVGLGLDSAQNAVGGGGRYDKLVGEMGGQPTPGIGFALGVERILLALAAAEKSTGTGALDAARLDAFIVDFAGGDAARDITAALRNAGLRADRAFDGRSPKSQFKAADRSGARVAIVVGPDEAEAGTAGIKDLRSGTDQVIVAQSDLVAEVRRLVGH